MQATRLESFIYESQATVVGKNYANGQINTTHVCQIHMLYVIMGDPG